MLLVFQCLVKGFSLLFFCCVHVEVGVNYLSLLQVHHCIVLIHFVVVVLLKELSVWVVLLIESSFILDSCDFLLHVLEWAFLLQEAAFNSKGICLVSCLIIEINRLLCLLGSRLEHLGRRLLLGEAE
jgi:hypothetical protein